MSIRKKAISSMIGGIAINAIKPYKNIDAVNFNTLDIKKSVKTNLSKVNSTRDISDNNNIINKTFYVKINILSDNTKQILLSEDDINWFPAYTKLQLYVDATYIFIQEDKAGYNNNNNPFLISSRNIYEKPRLFPLYDDNITYQVSTDNGINWVNRLGANPDGISGSNTYYTQELGGTGNITHRRLIFNPSKHKITYYIIEQLTPDIPNIAGGILNINPNYYKYGAAITNSGVGIQKNVNTGQNFTIDDIFIVNNKNTLYTTDKVNSTNHYNDYYNVCVGVGTTTPYSSLDLSSMKNAMIIPVGNDTTEKPTGYQGMIRYNNEIYDYEGKGSTEWGTLGGIQDIDMNTKIKLFAGEITDNLATLTAQTEDKNRFHMSKDGVGIQHNKPQAMLDIKGNMVMSNDTNIGGIITGNDLSLTDNYLNVFINKNTTNKSIDILSHNGGMQVNIKKNQENIINQNKTMEVLQNLTETVSSYSKQIIEQPNILIQNSSYKQTITGNNQETYNNHYNDSIQALNLQVNGDSIESYHSSVTKTNKNTDKTKIINNNHDLLVKFNSSTSVLNNNEIVIKNNFNEINNLNNDLLISKNSNTTISGNHNLLINQNSIKKLQANASTQILKDNHIVNNNEVTNNYHNNSDLHTVGNVISLVKINLDTLINGNYSETIDSKEINILQNKVINIDNDKTSIVNVSYNIENKNNKTILNKNNKNKSIGNDYNLTISDNNQINYNKNNFTLTTVDQSELYKSYYNTTSTQPYLSNLGNTFTLSNELNSYYINYNKTVDGTVNNLYKNNLTRLFESTTPANNIIKSSISGKSDTTYKNNYHLKLNDISSKILYNDNTTKVTTNCLETYIKKLTSTVTDNSIDHFKDNRKIMLNTQLYNNINTNSDNTTNNITTMLLKDNFDLKINKLNTLTENTETVNYKNTHNSTIKGINNETYKSDYNIVSKNYNLSYDNLVLNKHNTDSLTIHQNSTEIYSKNSLIKIENNLTNTITNNINHSIIYNSNNTIELDSNHLVKQSLTETIGSNHTNHSHVKHIKQTKTIIVDNTVNETFNHNKTTVQNSLDIDIASTKNRIRIINNNNIRNFNLNNVIKVESNNIETITGNLNTSIYDNFTIEEHYGEIQLTIK